MMLRKGETRKSHIRAAASCTSIKRSFFSSFGPVLFRCRFCLSKRCNQWHRSDLLFRRADLSLSPTGLSTREAVHPFGGISVHPGAFPISPILITELDGIFSGRMGYCTAGLAPIASTRVPYMFEFWRMIGVTFSRRGSIVAGSR